MFSKNSFRNTIRLSNSLDPDQAQQNGGPDLGPNCLQMLSVDDTSRKRVNSFSAVFIKWNLPFDNLDYLTQVINE